MLLIFGISARYKTLGTGTFHCPHEGADREFHRRQARRWFTLFFIPVIPLRVLGEFIECTGCGSAYDEVVLKMPTAASMMDNLANAMRYAVVAIVTADGEVTDEERRRALEIMERFSDTPYTRQELAADLRDLDVADLSAAFERVAGQLNEHGKEELVTACVDLSAADGTIDDVELAEIRTAAGALGMSRAHVRGVIAEARDRIGQQ